MAEQIRSIPSEQFGAEVVAGLTEGVPPAFRPQARAALAQFVPNSMANLVREAARFDLRAVLPGLAVPTLMAYGHDDAANRGLCEDLAARIGHAQVVSIPGAGHVANLDAPLEFNAVLTSFLDQHGC